MKKKKNGHNGQSAQAIDSENDSKLELRGVVEDAIPGTWFSVITESKVKILATLSGKLRQNHIKILPGDEVMVEVSPYDTSRGRISWRK